MYYWLKKQVNLIFLFLTFCLLSMVAMPLLASEGEVVGLDVIVDSILALIKNWKGLGTLGALSSILVLLVQLLKTELLGGWFEGKAPLVKRALIVIFGVINGVILSVWTGGLSWMEAIMGGLLVSGGAMAIYEVIKPFIKKDA